MFKLNVTIVSMLNIRCDATTYTQVTVPVTSRLSYCVLHTRFRNEPSDRGKNWWHVDARDGSRERTDNAQRGERDVASERGHQ